MQLLCCMRAAQLGTLGKFGSKGLHLGIAVQHQFELASPTAVTPLTRDPQDHNIKFESASESDSQPGTASCCCSTRSRGRQEGGVGAYVESQ